MALPEFGPDREETILDFVRQGQYEVSFSTITSTYKNHTAEFQVFSDALKIEGVRINVTAKTEQKIADMLDCLLLTPMLADKIWAQRSVTVPPFPRQITSTTAAMVEHSQKIDDYLAKKGNPLGLIATVGKHWVIDNDILLHPGKAMNYGWHFEGPNFQGISGEICATKSKGSNGQFVKVIQGRGTAHNDKHTDYSQTCVLVSRSCLVDEQKYDLVDLLQDPELAPLASHQGPLQSLL